MLLPPKNHVKQNKRGAVIPFPPSHKYRDWPVRNVITRSKPTVRSTLPSTKVGRTMGCESHLESCAFVHIDLSPAVETWCVQPFTVDLRVVGHDSQYTPDAKIQLTNGRILIAEIKPLEKCLDEKTKNKLVAAHEYFKRSHWEFVVITDQDIGSRVRRDNLNLLRYYIRVSVTHRQRVLIRRLVDENEFLNIFELEAYGFPRADIYSLLANGALVTDLDSVLSPSSPITLPEEMHHETCLFASRSATDL